MRREIPIAGGDTGLRDHDLVAFVACEELGRSMTVVGGGQPIFVRVGDMRKSVGETRLGPPKSASEGAERDREWPCWVPARSGEVLEVGDSRIRVRWSTGNRYTYKLKGKRPYVKPGDSFSGRTSVLAGVLPELVSPKDLRNRNWNALAMLHADSAGDRYAAARAIPYLDSDKRYSDALLQRLTREPDVRVALELAASLAKLGGEEGFDHLVQHVRRAERADMRMEAVLILSEVGSEPAGEILSEIATNKDFRGEELRQAAAWGLGRTGGRRYDLLLPLLEDDDDAVVLHAISAFGPDTPSTVVDGLIDNLETGPARARAAASEALLLIESNSLVRKLIEATRRTVPPNPWLLATLGRLPAAVVRHALAGDPDLRGRLEPLLLLTESENWLRTPEALADLQFLRQQNL